MILPKPDLIDTIAEDGVYGLSFSCDGKSLAHLGLYQNSEEFIVISNCSMHEAKEGFNREAVIDWNAAAITALPGDRLAVALSR